MYIYLLLLLITMAIIIFPSDKNDRFIREKRNRKNKPYFFIVSHLIIIIGDEL